MNRLDVVKEGTHSHPPIEEDLDVNQDRMDEDSAKEEESESSSSEETSVEESEDERAGEWVPWQEDEGTNEDTENEQETSENEEDDVDGYDLLHDKIRHYKSILRTLRESTPSLRESVFTSAEKGLICLFSEICWNVLEGTLSLSKQDKNLLKIFRDQIRIMGSENISWQEKRDFLIQNPHDACLPVLLTVLKPFIGTP
jgi:hypothetical protein